MSVLRRFVERVRARREKDEPVPLPPNAALIAVQHPSVTLPERSYDLVLFAAVLMLLGVGTVEIYSATAAESLTQFGSSSHYLARQLLYVCVGGFALWLGARIDYRKLRSWTYPLLLISILLLAAALRSEEHTSELQSPC